MNKDEYLVELKSKIENIDKEKHIEIFKILKEHEVPFSENKNGIFVNLSELSDVIIEKIETYIVYIKKQEEEFNIIEKQKEQYIKDFF